LYEINPSPYCLRLKVSLYDDYKSFLPLEPNFTVKSPLTSLEEVIDHPLPLHHLPLHPCLAHVETLLRVP